MSLRDRWRRWRNRSERKEAASRPVPTKDDLREFVYLDEVSLRSLLSSLKGDLREGRSEQSSDEIQAEVATAVEGNNPFVGKAGVSSRFQTTNSSSIQTSRKATVQSWFRDLHRIPKLRLIEIVHPGGPAADAEALLSTKEKSLVARSGDFQRGELVEFRVMLTADPVYHLSTMVSEFTGMADDYPEMFAAGNARGALQDAQPVNKILERLLAGLIPIRAVAIDYSVVSIDGVECVAHNDLLRGMQLKREPLQLVGVTEHLAYWKDLRRVLFSEAEFTILGRIGRTGLQPSWTPVKLAGLFQGLVPGLVNQINAAGRVPFATPEPSGAESPNEVKLSAALKSYATSALAETDTKLEQSARATLDAAVNDLSVRSGSASDQRTAFAAVAAILGEIADVKLEPSRDLELRVNARTSSGLSLFPSLASTTPTLAQPPASEDADKAEHLLDVEVIAIYW